MHRLYHSALTAVSLCFFSVLLSLALLTHDKGDRVALNSNARIASNYINEDLLLRDFSLSDVGGLVLELEPAIPLQRRREHPLMPPPSKNGRFESQLVPFTYYENSPVREILEDDPRRAADSV
jgi:hypothetical protein